VRILIDGENISPLFVSVNDGLNFGRLTGSGIFKTYSLVLSKNEFIDVLSNDYQKIRHEIKADDEKYGDGSDFLNAGYPSLSELLNFKKEFYSIFTTWLDRLLFLKLFPASDHTKFIIGSTDAITWDGSEIEITGKVYQKT